MFSERRKRTFFYYYYSFSPPHLWLELFLLLTCLQSEAGYFPSFDVSCLMQQAWIFLWHLEDLLVLDKVQHEYLDAALSSEYFLWTCWLLRPVRRIHSLACRDSMNFGSGLCDLFHGSQQLLDAAVIQHWRISAFMTCLRSIRCVCHVQVEHRGWQKAILRLFVMLNKTCGLCGKVECCWTEQHFIWLAVSGLKRIQREVFFTNAHKYLPALMSVLTSSGQKSWGLQSAEKQHTRRTAVLNLKEVSSIAIFNVFSLTYYFSVWVFLIFFMLS